MYVCICHAVTENDIEQAVHQGASEMHHLQAMLNVASCCGACSDEARACMQQALKITGPGCCSEVPA